jgi:hypothetical protein
LFFAQPHQSVATAGERIGIPKALTTHSSRNLASKQCYPASTLGAI